MNKALWLNAFRPLCLLLAVLLLCACSPAAQSTQNPVQSLSAAAETPPASAPPASAPEPESGTQAAALKCIYYERELFLAGMADPREYTESRKPLAGVVPHHLLAADMLSGFFALAARHQYDTVFILSPSHYPERCGSYVTTCERDWDTPFGRVQTDTDLVGALLQDGVIQAENNPAAMEFDHGGAGLIPYVSYYLPNAKVAVCLVSAQTSRARMQALQQQVFAYAAEHDVLFLSSVDFSHYLQPEEAAVCDEETAQSIAAFDYDTIARFSSRNVDSPPALAAFLYAVEHWQAGMVQLDHSSSQEKITAGLSSPVYEEGVTTYFIYAGFEGGA